MSGLNSLTVCLVCFSYIAVLSGCSGGEQAEGNQAADEARGDIITSSSQSLQTKTVARRPVQAETATSDLDFPEDGLTLDSSTPTPSIPESNTNQPSEASSVRATGEFRPIIVVDPYDDESIHMRWGAKDFGNGKLINHGRYQEFHRNGKKFCEGTYSDGARIGKWTFWHANGQLARKGEYTKSKPVGNWETYREDGTLSLIESYVDGLPDGRWTYYHSDGSTVLRHEEFKQGQRSGTWSTWYKPDGTSDKPQLNSIAHFQNGLRHGEGTGWYSNGQQASLENYRDGKRHGVFKIWNRDGSVSAEGEHENGIRK